MPVFIKYYRETTYKLKFEDMKSILLRRFNFYDKMISHFDIDIL